jgi:hypothetical protein
MIARHGVYGSSASASWDCQCRHTLVCNDFGKRESATSIRRWKSSRLDLGELNRIFNKPSLLQLFGMSACEGLPYFSFEGFLAQLLLATAL